MSKIAEHTPWALARLACCLDPDSPDSPGAKYLALIADDMPDILERISNGEDRGDAIHEKADSVVPVYTHDVWTTFVDLGGYRVDVDEYAAPDNDMTQRARVALYLIARQLLDALTDEVSE